MPLVKTQNLPAHLSYKSCLILIPPTTIQAPIEALRKVHDRNYRRWMPHINLIYPFLAKPSESMPAILQRVRRAVEKTDISFPIDIRIRAISRFDHSKSSSTVWLAPQTASRIAVTIPDATVFAAVATTATSSFPTTASEQDRAYQLQHTDTVSGDALLQLQSCLQTEFEECDADTRPFKPHLSIGQAKGPQKARSLELEAETAMEEFCKASSSDSVKQSTSPCSEIFARDSLGDDGGKDTWELRWLVDKILIAERQGFKDRFKVVGELDLGQ